MSSITIVIADRDEGRRNCCLNLLKSQTAIQVVGVAKEAFEVIAASTVATPRILLLDLSLIKKWGPLLLSTVRRKSPQTKVILLTDAPCERQLVDALSQGAFGYVENNVVSAFLLKAVSAVHAGEAWVPRAMVTKLVYHLTSNPR